MPCVCSGTHKKYVDTINNAATLKIKVTVTSPKMQSIYNLSNLKEDFLCQKIKLIFQK